ncbi:DNA methyltransferase 1-associated protein 1 isoform X1 [Amia ocellicauda]|uniref:DNA methyltransferase 1-associated protein 1 isoform X1 n=2 Tax=Amia ocellicauda TaxID=2972642 RepID=UPI003464BBFF
MVLLVTSCLNDEPSQRCILGIVVRGVLNNYNNQDANVIIGSLLMKTKADGKRILIHIFLDVFFLIGKALCQRYATQLKMTTGADVRDILELGGGEMDAGPISKKDIINSDKKKSKKSTETLTFKRPEGMHREVYALLYSDKKDAPPLLPSDTTQGYRTVKAKLGCKRVRPWKWMPFTNPARRDGAIFYHWRRMAEEGKDYPFARFNKTVQVPVYSEQEYQMYLHDDGWTKAETDHLFDLCKRFDLRFIVIHDRYDHQQFRKRSVEDLKERYYNICAKLTKIRAPSGTEPKIYVFDAGHERRRKDQLERLYNRTPEQVAEEEYLIQELRKIETRKKEREKKAQDLQKLITAADTTTEMRRAERKATKKKLPQKRETEKPAVPETAGIKFPDFKSAGVTLRSQRMKLPSSVGQKKIKAIEQILTEQAVDLNPMPTEEIVQMFNELRSDLVLVYELKQAHANCEYEQQMLRHRYEALLKAGGTSTPLGEGLGADGPLGGGTEDIKGEGKDQIIDVVGAPLTPNSRKRRESASSSSSIKKAKKL